MRHDNCMVLKKIQRVMSKSDKILHTSLKYRRMKPIYIVKIHSSRMSVDLLTCELAVVPAFQCHGGDPWQSC